ncbi:MAG: methionyl-tRNA formyltransferase [Candidatus Margulisiibacteriota bacterium]
MKIIFMGTPEGAAFLLDKLAGSENTVVAAVTRPDKPKGRGLKVRMSPVAEKAEQKNIPVLKPANVSDSGFLNKIKALSPDIIIVAAFGRILPKTLLDIPKYGCINVHLSLLPYYRGASPVQSALLNGDKETGITVIQMNERLDEGDILVQETIRVKENENAGELTERLFKTGTELLLKILPEIEAGRIKPVSQDGSKAVYCKTVKKADGLIDFNSEAAEILNKVRAFTPWPGAYLNCKGKTVKITAVESPSEECGPAVPGTVLKILKGRGLLVAAHNGCILIKEVQPENSKKMSADAFVNGYRIKTGENIS